MACPGFSPVNNGVIDSDDAVFRKLRIWIDANHDGVSQPEELHTLQNLGITQIDFDFKLTKTKDQYGNIFRYRSKMVDTKAHADRTTYDVLLRVQ